MSLVRTHILLPEDLLAEVDALVGKRGRSKFISEVLADQLVNARQRRLARAVLEFARAHPDAGPPEWATTESTREWVHDLRHFESDRERRIRETWIEPAIRDVESPA